MSPVPPCINCITLSMCKARVNNGDLFDLMGLTDMCPDFRAYMFPDAKPIITATQKYSIGIEDTHISKVKARTHVTNEMIDKRINGLKSNLLKGITLDGNFNL